MVDLPAPFGPIRPVRCPAWAETLTRSTATTPSNARVSSALLRTTSPSGRSAGAPLLATTDAGRSIDDGEGGVQSSAATESLPGSGAPVPPGSAPAIRISRLRSGSTPWGRKNTKTQQNDPNPPPPPPHHDPRDTDLALALRQHPLGAEPHEHQDQDPDPHPLQRRDQLGRSERGHESSDLLERERHEQRAQDRPLVVPGAPDDDRGEQHDRLRVGPRGRRPQGDEAHEDPAAQTRDRAAEHERPRAQREQVLAQ